MILYRGELCEDRELPRLLERLEADCLETIAGQSIDRETVVAACDALARRVEAGDYDSVLQPFLTAFSIDPARFREALFLFKREALSYKLAVELGSEDLPDLTPPGRAPIRRRRMPLGVLFHMAAGNVDGLPAYSVVEGLLAGNVNILKLPAQDRGASLLLLRELVRLEPRLRDFVYVFDVPSTDLQSLERFAKIADAVVVWGGDEAVRAARTLAGPDTALICWGHKLSFAYAVPPVSDGDLEALADHICATGQLLCSSCQGIFLDTGDMGEVYALAERLFPILQAAARRHPPADPALRARATLELYARELEADSGGQRIYRGGGVSVTAAPDSRLELGLLAGNCWVKPLPRDQIVPRLKPRKGCLQTAGLLCPEGEREALSALLARAGVVRVTGPGDMSRTVPGEAHDGTYPLAAYTRVVEVS